MGKPQKLRITKPVKRMYYALSDKFYYFSPVSHLDTETCMN